MNSTVQDVIFGTTQMLSIVMCIMVIFFLAMLIKEQHKFDIKLVYKHWVLFTGITFTFGSLLFDVFGLQFFKGNGFNEMDLKLLSIYNGFVRMLGVGFVMSWVLFFLVFDMSAKLDSFIDKKLRGKKIAH